MAEPNKVKGSDLKTMDKIKFPVLGRIMLIRPDDHTQSWVVVSDAGYQFCVFIDREAEYETDK